jgi:hypothetical protein
MTLEEIHVSSEVRRKISRQAKAAGMTEDEYIASAFSGVDAPTSEATPTRPAARAAGSRSERVQQMLDQMMEMQMIRALGNGQDPAAVGNPGNNALVEALNRLNERLDEMESGRRKGGPVESENDSWLRDTIKEGVRMKMVAPLLKSLGGEDDGTPMSKFIREQEREARDRFDALQKQLLEQNTAHTRELAEFREKAAEARLVDMKSVVDGLREEIGSLSDTVMRGPPGSTGNAAEQLQATLTQASAIAQALDGLSRRNAPEPPRPGEKRDTIETIGYLAQELSGAVSKGLEAVAKVNAANRGINPDVMGRMPYPPMQGAMHQPHYAPESPPAPARRAAPPRFPASAPPESAPTPDGMHLHSERPRAAPAAAPVEPTASEAGAETPELQGPTPDAPEALPPLPPIPDNVEGFVDPQGRPISRQEFEQIRLAHYMRTGRDPIRKFQGGVPVDEGAETQGGEDAGATDGASNPDPA